MPTSEHFLTPTLMKLLKTKGYSFECYRCQKPIHVGEAVITSIHYSGIEPPFPRKMYHKTCYDSMFVDVDDLSPEEEAEA